MARFDTTKAIQGGLNFAAYGQHIGNQFKKKYGNKAGIIGGVAGGISGAVLGGLQGSPDPNLAGNVYQGMLSDVEADVARGAHQAAREAGAAIGAEFERRGINQSVLAASVTGNQAGRIYQAAQESLTPLRTQVARAVSNDKLHALRIGEYERRQGWSDTLLGLGASAAVASRNVEDTEPKERSLQEMRNDAWIEAGIPRPGQTQQGAVSQSEPGQAAPRVQTSAPSQNSAMQSGATPPIRHIQDPSKTSGPNSWHRYDPNSSDDPEGDFLASNNWFAQAVDPTTGKRVVLTPAGNAAMMRWDGTGTHPLMGPDRNRYIETNSPYTKEEYAAITHAPPGLRPEDVYPGSPVLKRIYENLSDFQKFVSENPPGWNGVPSDPTELVESITGERVDPPVYSMDVQSEIIPQLKAQGLTDAMIAEKLKSVGIDPSQTGVADLYHGDARTLFPRGINQPQTQRRDPVESTRKHSQQFQDSLPDDEKKLRTEQAPNPSTQKNLQEWLKDFPNTFRILGMGGLGNYMKGSTGSDLFALAAEIGDVRMANLIELYNTYEVMA